MSEESGGSRGAFRQKHSHGEISIEKPLSHLEDGRNKSKPTSSELVTKTKKIFIGGLSSTTTIEDCKKYFSQYGKTRPNSHHRGGGFYPAAAVSREYCGSVGGYWVPLPPGLSLQTSNKEWVNEYTVPALYGTYTVARGHRSSSRPRATWIRHDVEGSERNHATMWTQGVGRKSNVEKLVGEALCETNA
ncbi:hypothetical protein RRG08_033457 [Elysia crispata]|uniref:RRM domain-containing protein n=1 Tax=Elysia crispata TaxID=231223 RepID=A0AAE1ATT2_9GAST|nr:hypothetical protein RRG08_033457 [Elysia crispata]